MSRFFSMSPFILASNCCARKSVFVDQENLEMEAYPTEVRKLEAGFERYAGDPSVNRGQGPSEESHRSSVK
jgi:hypothetical protein